MPFGVLFVGVSGFQYGFFGKGDFPVSIPWLLYSIGFTIVLLLIGVMLFNRVEKKFIDTV